MIDATHDAGLKSWVSSANGHADFPIQNLPLGVFSPPGEGPRGGVAIGDMIVDLRLLDSGLSAAGPTLNAFLGEGAAARRALRQRLSALLAEGSAVRPELLHEAAACTLHVPAEIGDYTDFFAGIHHALAGGRMLRPDQPLMPNYKYVPVAYHGRASSVRASGAPVRRPSGQRKPGNAAVPEFGPTRALDYELELGVWIGPGNALGEPIPIGKAADHIAGFCLLNDWSARDVQGWEYQPLGPFLAKSFQTTVSPWIVTAEAMAPFRVAQAARPEGDPAPLPYLFDVADQAGGALDLELEVVLCTREGSRHRLSLGQARHLYWTVAQMVAHHASNGCNLRPGDLFGTGTISGPEPESAGSLLELSMGGRQPIVLPSGETRRFLEDGDTIEMFARARREGVAGIGFGACVGTVVSA